MGVVMGTNAVKETHSPPQPWAILSSAAREHGTYRPIGKDNMVPITGASPVTDSRPGVLPNAIANPVLQLRVDGGAP